MKELLMKEESFAKAFGQHLAATRKMNALKQGDLARSIGVCQSFLCDIEKGRKVPRLFMLHLLEKRLGKLWPIPSKF